MKSQILLYLSQNEILHIFTYSQGKCNFSHCSVLDLNAFERQNKAEGLGMVTEEGSGTINLTEIICELFSFTFCRSKLNLKEPCKYISRG